MRRLTRPEESAQQVVDFYVDEEDALWVGSALSGLGAIFLIFFGGWLRRLLRNAEGNDGILSAVAFGGALVLAAGVATSATLTIAITDAADDIDPTAVEALNAFSWGFWVPFAVGAAAMFIATGLSVIKNGALPKWLGWVALVAGVAAASPIWFIGFTLAGLWIIVVGIMAASGRVATAR